MEMKVVILMQAMYSSSGADYAVICVLSNHGKEY